LAYIDLNPVRAGIVKRPEDYRWSGIGYRIYTDNKGDFFSFDGIFSESDMKELPKEELIKCYRYFVYKCGNIKRLSLADIEEGKEKKGARQKFGHLRFDKSQVLEYTIYGTAYNQRRLPWN
jgi:hypothetical protein